MRAEQTLRIVIADDHPIVRKGLCAVVAEDPQLQIVADVADGAEAWNKIQQLQPDVAILDYTMPKLNGLEVVAKLRMAGLQCAYVLLTMHKREDLFNAAMDEGFLGFILKDNAIEELLQCIHAVAQNRHFISPDISDFLLRRGQQTDRLTMEKPGLARLTPAERRVLKLIAEGCTSKEIARALELSPRTVDNHRARMARKLELSGTHSLLKFAFDHRSSL